MKIQKNRVGVWILVMVILAFSVWLIGSKIEQNYKTTSLTNQHIDKTTFQKIRENVSNTAQAALPEWLAKISKVNIRDFGFQSYEDISRATLAPPIPVLSPDRDADKQAIEKSIEERRPDYWLVPIVVNDRITCFLSVNSTDSEQPRVTGLNGKSYRGNRIESVLRSFDESISSYQENLYILIFYEPDTDFLLTRKSDEQWKWFDFGGINGDGPVTPLNENTLSETLMGIKNQKPLRR
ncbi:MAG: hypothetical protein WCG84_00795 [Candidatus Moraniibacteriota bacterium]